MVILIKYPKFTVYFVKCVYLLTQVSYPIFRNKILKMNVVLFEISTANPKEYAVLFYSNNLFILIRKYLVPIEKLSIYMLSFSIDTRYFLIYIKINKLLE